jgi:predicted nuclease with TOPRIM domain
MKAVVYEDQHGYLRRVLIRDDDPDEMAKHGLPAGPPDIENIDWEMIRKETNNKLVELGVQTRYDLQRTNGIKQIANIVSRHVDAMFREADIRKREQRKPVT